MGGCCTSKAASEHKKHTTKQGVLPPQNKYMTTQSVEQNPKHSAAFPDPPSNSHSVQPNKPTARVPVDQNDVVLLEANQAHTKLTRPIPNNEEPSSHPKNALGNGAAAGNLSDQQTQIIGNQKTNGNEQAAKQLQQFGQSSPNANANDESISKKMYQASPIPAYKALQIEQSNELNSRRQTNAAAAIGQQQQQAATLNANGMQIGESIDNVEQLLQSKSRSGGVTGSTAGPNERQNSSNRASIHKENYQQLTSSILARNDIFIFSNSALATSLNTSKHAKRKKDASASSTIYYTLSEKEAKAYLSDLKKQSKNEAAAAAAVAAAGQINATQSTATTIPIAFDGATNPPPLPLPQMLLYSTFTDWSKILEKQLASQLSKTLEKEPKSKMNPLFDIFGSLMQLKERAWYEEITALYKERNSASRINMNMQETVFYKKLTMIHDHFRWLISSIANTTFNVSSMYSSFEFPPQSNLSKRRKTSSVNSASGGKQPSSEKSEAQQLEMMQQPTLSQQQSFSQGQQQQQSQLGQNAQQQQSQPHSVSYRHLNINTNMLQQQQQPSLSNMNSFSGAVGSISPLKRTFTAINSESVFVESLPEAHSPLWVRGFIWRGVYLKLLSIKAAHTLKAEIKALKHVGLEYLQSEFSVKINPTVQQQQQQQQQQVQQQQQSQQQFVQQNQQTFVNYVLPLISFVETASFVVYGTPFIFTRTNSPQESLLRQCEVKPSNQFQNTYLLRNLKESNLQIIHKLEDSYEIQLQSGASSAMTGSLALPSVSAGPQTTAASAAAAAAGAQNVCQVVVQVRDLIPKHSEGNVMFMVNQDSNCGMHLSRVPKEGFLEISSIKKMLGYANIEFNVASLNYNQSKTKMDKGSASGIGYPMGIKSSQQQQYSLLQTQPLSRSQNSNKLDYLTFKLHGWQFKMIYVSHFDSKYPFLINRRATELLSQANKKSKDVRNIYGNALVFGKQLNSDAMVLPNLLYSSESYAAVSNNEQQNKSKSLFSIEVNETREKYLANTYKRAVDQIVSILDETDQVLHSKALSNIFHKNGLNMRYLLIVYAKLRSEKAKNLVGCVILARVMKRVIGEQTSRIIKKMKQSSSSNNNNNNHNSNQNAVGAFHSPDYENQGGPHLNLQSQQQQGNYDIDESEKNDLFNENIFKSSFTRYLNLLLKGMPENEEEGGLSILAQAINLLRLETISHAMEILSEGELTQYLNFSSTVKRIISTAEKNANLFLQVCAMHFELAYTPELEHSVRNDKYYFLIRAVAFKMQDVAAIHFMSVPYLTIKEIAYFFLVKLANPTSVSHAEIELPAALYKTRADCSVGGLLSNAYYMPVGETLKDLISYLNCIFGSLFSQNSEQTFFLELYVFQLFDSFFISKDDEDSLRNLMNEKIQPLLQNSFLLSGELAIVIYTWFGILQETKSLLECEQSYMMALLALHKLYGDPRGRGSTVMPWELFIVWRLSMIARLQGKKHDAEYVEELYDSVVFDLQANPQNLAKFSDSMYSSPFQEFDEQQSTTATVTPKSSSQNPNHSTKYLQDKPLPFSHWTECQNLDENFPIMEALTSSLRNNKRLLQWMMEHLLIFSETGVLWETHSLRVFQLCIMQNTFPQTSSSCGSSVSSLSDKNDQGTPKSQRLGQRAPLFPASNQSGNIVQTLEKDFSTFSKKDAVGVMFSWGQNTQGQLGNVYEHSRLSPVLKKIKIHFPKLVVPLKDTLTTSVACGFQHSMAITYSGDVVAWGDNSHLQLGLGATHSASSIGFPTRIANLKHIVQIACGSEHSIALDRNGLVFTWGNGEGGLLGHGDEESSSTPKIVDSLRSLQIECIASGGLHSLVLTKTRHIYSWGRNEGGQLGIEPKYFTNERCYLTSPHKIRGHLEAGIVVQIAAGEAHSLALAQNGQVYGWGYNMNGQIGLGQAAEPYPIYQPQLIPKLTNIDKIYSGQTFSIFMNNNKEVFCCGLNDANQLGIEKEPIKILNNTQQAIDQKRVSPDVFVPKKMDCFHQIPVLHISCGHNHSLALVVVDTKHYMLFAWGMNKHGQLGIGETGQTSSVPRPITYLQDITTYSIACGSYHSLVIANDVNRILKRESVRVIKESFKKFDTKWNFTLHESSISQAQLSNSVSQKKEGSNLAVDIPNTTTDISEEGKIEFHQPMKKTSDFNTKTKLA